MLKSKSSKINIDPEPYVKYQNPSLSSSQDIVLTRLFHCYNGRVEGGTSVFWIFVDFRCGAWLFMVIHVIFKYENR